MIKTHLLDYFEETVVKKSDCIAIKHNDQEISFCDLHNKSKKLGLFIISQIKEITNKPIAVFLPKEINTAISDLGILYSSNPFMNLDVKTPKERLMNIFELVKPAAVITTKKYSKILEDVTIPLIYIDE